MDGPCSPGNKIDVYMEPLTQELNDLWHEGMMVYDGQAKEMFRLHAGFTWTRSDFPAPLIIW